MMSGNEFVLAENEANAVMKAMETKSPVRLSFGVLNGSSVDSVIDEEQAKLRSNRIINDENFKELCAGNGRAIDLLNNRYSGDKFEKEWEEALDYKKKLNDSSDRQLSTTT